MDEAIDWEAVARQLQLENEEWRRQWAGMRLAQLSQKSISFSRQDVLDLLKDKRFWFGVVAGAILSITEGIAPYFVEALRGKK